MQTLLDSQKKAINKLQRYKVGALFMEPGTGKTLAALQIVAPVNPDYILWLTPFQTKKNLFAELNKMNVNTRVFDIQGIESLSNSDSLFLDLLNNIQSARTPVVIVDESLKIKNADAKRTRRIIEIGKYAKYKLILNGTPLSRNLLDLWPQMEFLSHKILCMNLTEYKNTFVEYTTITKRLGNKTIQNEFINKYHNIDYLYQLIKPYIFESELKLSTNKQYIDVAYSLTDEELNEHNEIKAKYLDDERMQFRNNNIFLEITQKLQHNYSCSPEKFDIVKGIMRNNDKNKIIIFAKYVDTQDALKKAFPNILVLSWQKHSFGLNLQEYNRIIFFDKVWDYALRDQAEHRIYRTGQLDDVVFYDLTANVGLDDLINKNISKKQSLLEYFKKHSIKELMNKL